MCVCIQRKRERSYWRTVDNERCVHIYSCMHTCMEYLPRHITKVNSLKCSVTCLRVWNWSRCGRAAPRALTAVTDTK